MLVRRQVSPLFTVALLCGTVCIYHNSPWISSAQGSRPRPVAEFATVEEKVPMVRPPLPPGYRAGLDMGAAMEMPASTAGSKTSVIASSSSLYLADPKVAKKVKLPPQRREKIAEMVSNLNACAEKMMYQAIREWRKQGGVTCSQLPDFKAISSPHHQKLATMARKTEQEIASLLNEDELARWRAMGSPIPIAESEPGRIQAVAPVAF